jgi:hypothetical protein
MHVMSVAMAGLLTFAAASLCLAEGTNQAKPRATQGYGGQRQAVPTQPSANPFKDPLSNVPPATSANPALNNSSRTTVPLRGER